MSDLTVFLDRIQQGEAGAAEQLLPLVYAELRKLAAQRMAREPAGQTLQATALVHEAWLRLTDGSDRVWNSRGHFFGAAAEAMRRILVENARHKRALRHGGGQVRVDAAAVELGSTAPDDQILEVHECLDELARLDSSQAELVKLRFFVGLKISEIALLRGVSEKTVQREWVHAKAWLFERIRSSSGC